MFCSAEEKYNASSSTTPESAADQRARKHLRLWVRRLNCHENYEARMLTTMTRGKKKSSTTNAKEPYEWVRCCNPSCGKWRALLKCMDVSSVVEAAKNGEWYCVMNTWDEKLASCAGKSFYGSKMLHSVHVSNSSSSRVSSILDFYCEGPQEHLHTITHVMGPP